MKVTAEIKRAIYEANDERAKAINTSLRSRGVFTVNFLGGPGAGKTTLITLISKLLIASGERVAVVEGDVASDIDTRRLEALGVRAFQIETGGDCHLNAAMMEAVLERMPPEDDSWLFIENIGNLVCPAEFVIGEDIKVIVASVSEGSDKPYKYPFIFSKSAACVLTKIDLKTAMEFDDGFFAKGLAGTAPGAPLFPLNGRTGEGAQKILAWLKGIRGSML